MDESSSRCSRSLFTGDVRQSLERTERQLCQGSVWTELWTAGRNQKEVRSHEYARAQREYQACLTIVRSEWRQPVGSVHRDNGFYFNTPWSLRIFAVF